MEISQINSVLASLFSPEEIENNNDENWQIQTQEIRLLILLSADKSWLRVLTPVAALNDAQPFMAQLMEANFDATGLIRYASAQNVLWGAFHHNFATLTEKDFQEVVIQMIAIAKKGLSDAFKQLAESRIRQIIQASKAQGQTKEATYQTLERFYQEGMLGDLDRDPQEREDFLAAWKMQLDRLWDE